VLEERKIRALTIEPGNYTFGSGFRAAQELLTKNKSIDCIIGGNDIIALGVMDAVRVIGLRIPEDVSVVGFDNIRMSEWPSYALTTWEQPLEEMTTSTVELLLKEIEGEDTTPQVVMMKGHLVVRKTVRSRK
jgi:DNA-binding LacI/PurR family transcriptional regulator